MTTEVREAFPHLSQAPITEALIDIQVTLPPEITVDSLKALHSKVKSSYPELKARQKWSGRIEFKEDKSPDLSSENLGIDGFLFASHDKLQIVQFRLDGFTFSRLRPYENWKRLRDEARRLWLVYREGTGVEAIGRIAVRYVNLLEITPGAALETVLTNPPKPPDGFSENVLSFHNRQVIQEPNTGTLAIITQVMEPPPGAIKIPLWLDIDIFRSATGEVSEEELWGTLEHLALLKNEVFFKLITLEAMETYK